MSKSFRNLVMIIVLICGVGIVAAQDDMSADIEAVTAVVTEDYGGYVNAHDAEGYVTMFSEDVLWSPPNGPDQTDADGIQTAVQGLFDRFEFDVEPQADEVEILGDVAYVVGTVDGVLTPRSGEDPVTIKFRVLWMLRNEDGDWKIFRQIWNNKPVEE